MSIASLGRAILDRIQRVADLPKVGGKYVARNYYREVRTP